MSIYASIHTALDTQLQTVVGLPALQLENTANVGKTGVAFSRATLIPSRSLPLNVGKNGSTQFSGLYQIDLFYPLNEGTANANAMVDTVVAAFPRGMLLSVSGVITQVETAWREAASRIEQFYSAPVVVQWTCLHPNQ